MVSLNWCSKQKRGISFIIPNSNLAREYVRSAEETLDVLRDIRSKSNMWLATTKYYCEYFSIYAVLTKIGIKCEIHDCSIELVNFLEKEGVFLTGTYKRLESDKNLRIDNQYYLKNTKVDIKYGDMLNFVLEIKDILNRLNEEKIVSIREKLKKKLNQTRGR